MSQRLPPLNTLPQWSRVNSLDKARYPKPFVKDVKVKMEVLGGLSSGSGDDLVENELTPAYRAQHLERSLLFLKKEHEAILCALHEEVALLKKENKELNFKIIMSQKSRARNEKSKEKENAQEQDMNQEEEFARESSSISSISRLLDEPEALKDKNEEMKVIFLEEEVKELKHALRETRNKNNYLTQLLEQADNEKKRQQAAYDALNYEVNQGGSGLTAAAEQIASGGVANHTNGQPLTLQQCHTIIKHLQQVNSRLERELDQLKLDLRDVLYSHKWTPDAYLMAKAYVAEDERRDEEKGGLPRLSLRNPSKKLPDIAYIRENVSLPALKQTVGNKAVERKKKAQVLQRAKLFTSSRP